MHLVIYVGGASEPCNGCRSCDADPHVPPAGTSTVSAFNGESQVDLPFWANLITLRFMGVFSLSSLLLPVRSENLQEARGAIRGARVGVLGRPECIRIDGGGGGEMRRGLAISTEWRAPLDS